MVVYRGAADGSLTEERAQRVRDFSSVIYGAEGTKEMEAASFFFFSVAIEMTQRKTQA